MRGHDLSNRVARAASAYKPGGTDVALADGGTGASLADPNADRLMFWDDSAGAVDWLTPGTGLSISGTTISASGGPTLLTEQATTSGTTKDFTIPSGAKIIWVMLNGVSAGSADIIGIQLGDSGGIEATGYAALASVVTSGATNAVAQTTRFPIVTTAAGTEALSGVITLARVNATHTWVASGNTTNTNGTTMYTTSGVKTLSAELTTVRLDGDGTFDAGSVNVMYQ